jgi:uncharacterized protein (DUF952 family)
MSDRPALAYKVLTAEEAAALEADRFAGSPADRRDGFVHLSTAAQLEGTLAAYYAGRDDLWLAAVDVAAAGPALCWEPSRGGDLFPHLHARLTLNEIVALGPLERGRDGTLRLPIAGQNRFHSG